MTIFKLIRGRWRMLWGFCPMCNSDAPKIYDCPVCSGLPKLWPPNYFVKQEWWKNFNREIITGLPTP